ncbi:hypothetical protein QJQ45_023188 [Haematococcus lacustris]|nr:hypothetical protein QJQ45_023188 [Haematococcus lacustris]
MAFAVTATTVSRTFSEDISSQLAAPKTGVTSNLGVALRGASYPFVHHATSSRVVKGERTVRSWPVSTVRTQDVMFTSALAISDSTLFMVCDGHSGPEAATFVASHFLSFVSTRLPGSLPDFNSSNGKLLLLLLLPEPAPCTFAARFQGTSPLVLAWLPEFAGRAAPAEVQVFAESVRRALCETFIRLDNEWASGGRLAGTTVTVVLCTGWLLTVANTGDSAAVLDTGCSLLELTHSHRIHTNHEEQARLKSAGQQLAQLGYHLQGPAKPGDPGVGPLRLWPGGLCVSRSLGDLDAGPEVLPIPHIRQVILPVEGCRVLLASDGLWDVLNLSKALNLVRSKSTEAAASTLATAVSKDVRAVDDASIMVVDIMPSEHASFPSLAHKANPQARRPGAGATPAATGGFFSCFRPEVEEPDSRDITGLGHLDLYCDVDCLRAYPGLKQLLARNNLHPDQLPPQLAQALNKPGNGLVDYTLHGAKDFGSGLLGKTGSLLAIDSPQGPFSLAGRTSGGGEGTQHSVQSLDCGSPRGPHLLTTLPLPAGLSVAGVEGNSHPPSFAIADSTKRYNSYVSTTQHNTTQHVAVPDVRRAPAAVKLLTERQQMSLPRRQRCVAEHFPSALGVDDFMARLEVALSGFGFTGENSIAITNLCRDEVTTVLKDKIEAVFGSSFNTNGLGAVLTCGVTGMGAGFSHSPVSNGKEHYVFFAFPHIGINSAGEVGAITRPGRSVKSCACGALQKCLIELKAEGYTKNCKTPGVHNPLDPEYSILKQRLARRVRYEGLQPSHMDLVTMTQVAERTITNDLMFLIEKMVDPTKANYAVVTGVQIHNWAAELSASSGVPSLEFVAPTDVLVMRHGTKFHINLAKVPTMSPRQLRLFANASTSDEERDVNVIIGKTIAGTLKVRSW